VYPQCDKKQLSKLTEVLSPMMGGRLIEDFLMQTAEQQNIEQ
jgi:hypothetical protein